MLVDGCDESVPYAYGMYAAIVYAQQMFIPRIYDICPRAPIVMRDCIYIIRCERARWIGPLRLRNVRYDCLCTTNVYSTCTQYLSQHHAADCPRTPTFTHVHPLWCVIAFIQFGVDGRDESAPTPTECTLRIVHVHQCLFHEHVIFTHVHQRLPTCIHCREPIYRTRILRNTRYGLFTHTNV